MTKEEIEKAREMNRVKVGDIVRYRAAPCALSYVVVQIEGPHALILGIVSNKRSFTGPNGVYKPTRKEWLMSRKKAPLSDLSKTGYRWGRDSDIDMFRDEPI